MSGGKSTICPGAHQQVPGSTHPLGCPRFIAVFVYPFSIISVFVVYSFAVLLFLCYGVLLCCMGGALRRLFVVNVCLYLGLIDRTE